MPTGEITSEQVADDEIHVYTPEGTWQLWWNGEVWELADPEGTDAGCFGGSDDALDFIAEPYTS